MELLESKSLLAKLMATENLVVEQRPVQTASFDVKNRILTLPVLDKNISGALYDLFTGHEVGHALYTPIDGMLKARKENVIRDVTNVVEDSRIERKIKHKYPGLKNSFVKAYGELMDRDFFGIKGTDINKMNFLDRINLHCKGGAALRIQFNDEERGLLNEVETTETYDNVIDVSKKIIEYMKRKLEEEEQKRAKAKAEGDDGDDEDQSEYEEVDFDDQGNSKEQTFEDGEDVGEQEVESNKQSDSDEFDSVEEDKKVSLEDQIRSFTDAAYKENEKQLFDNRLSNIIYANIPYFNPKDVVDHKYIWKKYKEENFISSTETFLKIRNERSHGLVMFLDWSGSMHEHIGNTMKQLINLVLFCKKMNIPYEVFAFVEDTDREKLTQQVRKVNDIYFKPYGLMNLLSSRMSSSEFTYACSSLVCMAGLANVRGYLPHWLHMQGTPLNQAIVHAMTIVPEFQKKNKLQIVNTIFLTDGESNNSNRYLQHDPYYGLTDVHMKCERLVIRDPVTKHEEKVDNRGMYETQTNAFIRLLKARTGSNIIGFYVITGRDFNRKIHQWFPKQMNHEEMKDNFRKSKFAILENTGYDEYYILRSNGLDTDEDSTFEVKEGVTFKGIASAFTKYNSGKYNSRVVLNRFIGLIT